jgi:hypothetical protein
MVTTDTMSETKRTLNCHVTGPTLDLTCWFTDLQKKIVEKTNSQTKKVNDVIDLRMEAVVFTQ